MTKRKFRSGSIDSFYAKSTFNDNFGTENKTTSRIIPIEMAQTMAEGRGKLSNNHFKQFYSSAKKPNFKKKDEKIVSEFSHVSPHKRSKSQRGLKSITPFDPQGNVMKNAFKTGNLNHAKQHSHRRTFTGTSM